MSPSYEERQAEIKRLALLCLEDRDLTDEELDQIIEAEKETSSFLLRCFRFAQTGVAQEKRYRTRWKELDELSTEELKDRAGAIASRRANILEADTHDDLDDSLFESPPIDSDEYIICELLKEREERRGSRKTQGGGSPIAPPQD